MATAVTTAPAAGTILAFDFGTRRIGVAVGETPVRLAHPLATIEAATSDDRFAGIASLIDEWRPVVLVVGLPTHADGTRHELTLRAEKFARQLQGRFRLPVVMVDERHTTEAANSILIDTGVRPPQHQRVRDQLAAQVILQAYFDDDPDVKTRTD